jgi:hypothetical protein
VPLLSEIFVSLVEANCVIFMILTGLPNMDSKDVEEIFKGVLTDESQESQESVFPMAAVGTGTSTPVHASIPHSTGMVSPSGSVTHSCNSLTTYCMSNFCIVGDVSKCRPSS